MQVKDRVLEALEANRGTYFSGEALAQKLAVSRSAVWKAIQQLRESGYPIEAASKRGYCLAKDSAILSAQSIAQYLTVPHLRLEVEQLVSSTNTLLRQPAELCALRPGGEAENHGGHAQRKERLGDVEPLAARIQTGPGGGDGLVQRRVEGEGINHGQASA